jgi:hypothetical protein
MANKNALLHSKMLLASIAGLVLLFVFGSNCPLQGQRSR